MWDFHLRHSRRVRWTPMREILQSECIDQLISYWGNLHRNHRILSQPTIARDIIEYMFGNGLAAYCSCGTCNPDWFLHGWICCPYVNPPWPWVVPDRNNLAWRRYTRTPLGRWLNLSNPPVTWTMRQSRGNSDAMIMLDLSIDFLSKSQARDIY